MSYQTPTTLAAVREGTLGNVGYSMSSDGRFTRGENNASPVPSTLSQQTSTLTQGHQAQPILAGTGHPYFFTTAINSFPNYQFGMYAVRILVFFSWCRDFISLTRVFIWKCSNFRPQRTLTGPVTIRSTPNRRRTVQVTVATIRWVRRRITARRGGMWGTIRGRRGLESTPCRREPVPMICLLCTASHMRLSVKLMWVFFFN